VKPVDAIYSCRAQFPYTVGLVRTDLAVKQSYSQFFLLITTAVKMRMQGFQFVQAFKGCIAQQEGLRYCPVTGANNPASMAYNIIQQVLTPPSLLKPS
jgi:hypothetical protein